MNQPSDDEFEEVESPFAARAYDKSSPRDRLRTRNPVFNRPFATSPTSAPLIIETKSTRKTVTHGDDAEMQGFRQSNVAQSEIDYLDDGDHDLDEEITPRQSPNRTLTKTTSKSKKNLVTKFGWAVVGFFILRLIFMDRGVWDYFSTEGEIQKKQDELRSIRDENKSLKTEISKIQFDQAYQKLLAKEHLGVIAADEFLILFAGENPEDESSETDNQI